MDDDNIIRKHQIDFHENLSAGLAKNKWTDFTILVGNDEFQVHKIILTSCSDYFRAMLDHDSLESRESRVTLCDITSAAMQAIIDFCYGLVLNIDGDNIQEVLIAALRLQVPAVRDLCVNFIKGRIDLENCLDILTIGERFDLNDLYEPALTCCLESFPTLIYKEDFPYIAEGLLVKLLSHDNLNVRDEIQVFEAISKWIDADPERISALDGIVDHVRFDLMEPIQLVSLNNHDLVRKSPKCEQLIGKAKDKLLLRSYPCRTSETSDLISKPRRNRSQRLFAVGGWTDEFKSIASAEMYDPNENKWIEIMPMAQKRCGVGLVALGDYIYAIGGHDGQNYLGSVERYSIQAKTWFQDVADMNHVRTSVAVATLGGKIYAVGGQINSCATNKVEMYDPLTNTWVERSPLNKKRLGAGIAVLDGYIYVMGGSESTTIYESVERYDPMIDKWTLVEKMTTPRKHLGSATCRNMIYAIGGCNRSGELNTVECYDPRTNIWTEVTPMHMKRRGIGVVELDGHIYVIGGQSDDARLNVVETYDPDSDSWGWKKPMNHGRLGGGMAVHPPRRY